MEAELVPEPVLQEPILLGSLYFQVTAVPPKGELQIKTLAFLPKDAAEPIARALEQYARKLRENASRILRP